MTDGNDLEEEGEAATAGVGPQLRAARERKGLTLDQVAAETRISKHHLGLIENGEFEQMPGRTYAVGFAKNYAKVVGLDQSDVAEMVRAEMRLERPSVAYGGHARTSFEPGDPARAPGGKLVWFSVAAVVLLMVGIFFASRVLFAPAAQLPSLADEQAAEEAEALAARQPAPAEGASPADASGPVVFTAEGEAWVRFYDAQGRVLTERTLTEGESYTVPADADGPQLLTGRPDLLAITVGGRPVPKISQELVTVSDVPVSARALMRQDAPAQQDSRPAAGPARATPAPTGAPTPTPTR